MRINQFIHTDHLSVSPAASFEDIKLAFKQTEFEFIPIVQETGEFLGAICKNDFLKADFEDFKLEEILEHKYVFDYYHILETIREFLKVERTELPVLDEEGIFLGVCKLHELQYHFFRVLGIIEGGSLIVIGTNLQNYSLVDIAKIVESNQAKVLTQYVSSHPDSEEIEVTLVLNIADINDIIATFERFKYDVKYTSTATDRDDFLKERYDSFMHFLDI